MSGYGWHPHIESALGLNLRDLFAKGALRVGCETWGGWHWTDHYSGEQVGGIGYRGVLTDEDGTLTLNYSHAERDTGARKNIECIIRLSSVPLRYGGRRWYMHCPYMHRRALKLYKFGSIEQFCCRTAIRPLPTYASQRVSGSDRIISQRWALRRKLGDEWSDLFGEPFKPKGMRWRTFEKYARRDAQLADREAPYLLRLIGLDCY